MGDLTTEAGRPILHFHLSNEGYIENAPNVSLVGHGLWELNRQRRRLTAEEANRIHQMWQTRFPDLELVSLPTYRYDCHGKTFGGKDCWINNDQIEL
jgi:hypothetical protein